MGSSTKHHEHCTREVVEAYIIACLSCRLHQLINSKKEWNWRRNWKNRIHNSSVLHTDLIHYLLISAILLSKKQYRVLPQLNFLNEPDSWYKVDNESNERVEIWFDEVSVRVFWLCGQSVVTCSWSMACNIETVTAAMLLYVPKVSEAEDSCGEN